MSLMLAGGGPVHVVAARHGHDPAVSLSIYTCAQRDDLRAADPALFGSQVPHGKNPLRHWSERVFLGRADRI
ncbi:hypothetical protein [Mycobacterium sp. Root265]|uniref:hypothetical protein n=1 Tax=Mycobacterium sp. Root265 TaxID=1736504 RepID=UPI001F3D491A|nr:hypothetical protein [Mycobacterium sp. Root265]